MNEIVRLALEEDIGTGDVTSIACVPETRMAAGRFLAREPLVLSGTSLLWELYQQRGGIDELNILKQDGDRCVDGDIIATVRGRAPASDRRSRPGCSSCTARACSPACATRLAGAPPRRGCATTPPEWQRIGCCTATGARRPSSAGASRSNPRALAPGRERTSC